MHAWTGFQNQLQIIVRYEEKDYDIKMFANGVSNITGCKSIDKCELISKMVIDKINNTSGATEDSEM